MAIRGLLVPLIISLGGCASTVPISTPSPPSVTRTQIEEITDVTLAQDYAAERSYRQDGDAPLKLGLALSGGGTKAALFAHGVLNGLHEAGVLQKVDVISTVSGGGYAAYWYFSKLISREKEEPRFELSSIFRDCIPEYWTEAERRMAPAERNLTQQLLVDAMDRALDPSLTGPLDVPAQQMPPCNKKDHFQAGGDDPFRWQAHLARWPDVFGTTPVHPDGSAQRGAGKEIRAGLIKGLFVEPFLQLFRYQSSIPRLYQWGIERTWGLNPKARDSNEAEREDWKYTNAVLEDQNHPLRVDPSKVSWRTLGDVYQSSARNAEPIPLWIINTNAGRKTGDARANLRRVFELTPFGSGSEEFGYVNNLDEPLIEDLGTSVRASAGFADSQGLSSALRYMVEIASIVIPGARWGVPVDTVNTSGEPVRLRLSDGGAVENLGLYSLLKRGVKDIIVVDSSEDIEGDMLDLCTIRKALGPNIEMRFPALEDFDRVCEGKLAYNVSDWKSPVVRGTVTWKRNGVTVRESRLWLLKAAWNQAQVRKTFNEKKCGEKGWADCFLTVFYGHSTLYRVDGYDGKSEYMMFPQIPTAGSTLNASSYFFWGYRELGRHVARNLAWNDDGDRLESRSTSCSQPAATKVRKDRPRSTGNGKAKKACVSVQ